MRVSEILVWEVVMSGCQRYLSGGGHVRVSEILVWEVVM